jgi:hypothetical protein
VSLSGIAVTLNKEKIPSKLGDIWSAVKVRNILGNCNYIGNVRYGLLQPERYFETEGKHDAIIDESLFREAQLIMEKNKAVTPTKRPTDKNYFLGVSYCGLCGTRLKSNAVYRDGKIHGNYVCYSRITWGCEAKKMSALKLEAAVIKYFANIADIVIDTEKEEQAKRETAARVEALQERITALDAKEKEMLDSYIADKASFTDYRSVKETLDGERARVRAEIESLTPPEVQTYEGTLSREEIITTFKKKWEGFTDNEKRQFLVKHIRKITVINQSVNGNRLGRCEVTDIQFNVE